jgi:hypothetical protein
MNEITINLVQNGLEIEYLQFKMKLEQIFSRKRELAKPDCI